MLYDIGAGEQIIGTNSFADYPEQAKSIPIIGNYLRLQVEKVLLKPIQLIIQLLSINQNDKEGFNWHDWPIIPAVKNQQLIQPNADAMHHMTMRSLKELKKLCADIDETRQWLHNKKSR